MAATALIVTLLLSSGLCQTVDSSLEDNSLRTALEDFTQESYGYLAASFQNKNFVFSPLNLHSAMTILYLGTADNSRSQEELQTALGGLLHQQLIQSQYRNLLKDYSARKPIRYGNHLWVRKNFTLKADYESLIRENFNAQLSGIDFKSERAVKDINGWIENITKGKIKELVKSIQPDTQLFLANALYFKENWMFPFEINDLVGAPLRADFHIQEGQSQPVNMMAVVNKHIQYEEFQLPGTNQGFSLIRIPYENKDFEMKIILPKATSGSLDLNALETYLNLTIKMDKTREKNIFRVKTTKANFSDVDLTMPRFTVRTKIAAEELFRSLGAGEIFGGKAELSKITDDGPLAISGIIHESVLEITKDGTEGAAATGVELVFFSSSTENTKKVVVDRPFTFILQDKKNDIPLMIGHIVDPTTL